jgi:hypothetical protein
VLGLPGTNLPSKSGDAVNPAVGLTLTLDAVFDSGCHGLRSYVIVRGRRIARDYLGSVGEWIYYASPDRLGMSRPSGAAAWDAVRRAFVESVVTLYEIRRLASRCSSRESLLLVHFSIALNEEIFAL